MHKEADVTASIMFALIVLFCWSALFAADATPEIPSAEPGFSTSQEPREAKLGEMLMAGFQVLDTMEHEALMGCWNQFMGVVEQLPADPQAPYYGINFFTADYNPQEHTGFGYMACVPVLKSEGIPEGVVLRKIPARDYIVFEHKGPLMYLEQSFNYIFNQYLPQGKHKALYADLLEVYDCRFNAESPDSVIEIWVPVQPQE